MGAVTAQGNWRDSFWAESQEIRYPITKAVQPSYKDLIPPSMVRRMSRGIKMGIYAAQQALDDAGIALPDAIITGTGLGCSEDSEKFLRNILDNEEQFLTPTSFIQSTHNTVAAQIALRLQCKGYNFTYVNRSVSFESALLDGLMQLQHGEADQLLVGGVDEVSDHTYMLLQRIGHIKPDGITETVRESQSIGVNYAEGASFFALSGTKTERSYAELADVLLRNVVEQEELGAFVQSFLEHNGLQISDVDTLVLGINGDQEYDSYYRSVMEFCPDANVLYYKHLVGQFDSCSAFALIVAAYVATMQTVDPILHWEAPSAKRPIRNILLYNHYKGRDHSLLLVRTC